MSAPRPATADRSAVADAGGDGRTHVRLDDLLALRLRVPAHERLRRIAVRSRDAGIHAGRMRGRGMDYAESRVYQPGDDVRQIDWRLTARSGRMHTKLFQEERERSFMTLLDTNPALRFGTRQRFKSVQAARAVALATWQAERAGERVGAMAFGCARQLVKPRRGQRGALAVLGSLVCWDAMSDMAGETLSDALRRAARVMRGASQLLIVSDGHSMDDAAREHLVQLRRRTDVCVLIVADVLELAAPPPGRYPLAVGQQHVYMDLTAAHAREAFRRSMHTHIARMIELCRSTGVRQRVISTVDDPLPAIQALRRGRA